MEFDRNIHFKIRFISSTYPHTEYLKMFPFPERLKLNNIDDIDQTATKQSEKYKITKPGSQLNLQK